MSDAKLYVLLLDDDPVEISLIKTILRKNLEHVVCFDYTLAPDWSDCLKSHHLDAIVIDYRLPNRNGLEEIKDIRKINSDIPIYLITAFERDEIDQNASEAGATDFIVKDRSYSNLLSKLRNLFIQKVTEEHSRRLKEQFELLNEFSPLVILKIGRSGNVVSVFGNTKKVLDCIHDELSGNNWWTILPLYKIPKNEAIKILNDKISNENLLNQNPIEVEVRTKNNQMIWIRFTEVFSPDEHILLMMENITGQKKLEKQLLSTQRLETIGSLAAGIAHDFNNILAAIQGYASLGIKNISNSGSLEKYLNTIISAAHSGSELSSQLLAFSKKVATKRKILSFNSKISEAINILRRTISPQIEIVFNPSESTEKVFIDPGHAVQIILNLCLNACDAMPNGGILTLKTARTKVIDENTGSEKRYLKFSVHDTGIGIKLKEKEKIFDPFYTTKESGKGTGLGLSVVKNIIESYNGLIEFESNEKIGTTFTVYLPESDQAETEEKIEDVFSRGGNEGILIVDDEETIRNFSSEYLSDLGYKIFTASDGKEAIEIFSKEADKIDLMILDLTLPKKSGIEVLNDIKKINSDIKIVLSSGYTLESNQDNLIQTQVDDFIQKPYTVEKLAEVVRKNLDK